MSRYDDYDQNSSVLDNLQNLKAKEFTTWTFQ